MLRVCFQCPVTNSAADAYPYFQSTFANSIGNGGDLFFDAYNQTVAATKGKPVWVTETGWPVSGETVNQAVPSADNARIYWEDVTCKLVNDNVNLYYYILQDVQWGNPSPSFGIKPGGDLAQVSPLFDLSCPAKNVSNFPTLVLSLLSPLLFTLIANLLLLAFLLPYLLPSTQPRCKCLPHHLPVQHPTWAAKPSGWIARAKEFMKNTFSSPTTLSSDVGVLGSRSSLGSFTWPTRNLVNDHSCWISANDTIVKASSAEAQPTIATPPVITSDAPTPTEFVPTAASCQSRSAIESLPEDNAPPVGLQSAFEASSLIVPVDKSNSSKVIGNGYVAQLSPTLATVFVFDVRPEHQGKVCNLAFHMPPASPWPDMSPIKVRSPGGIVVSGVGQQAASADVSASKVVSSGVIGWIPSISPSNQYDLVGFSCPAGQRVAYQAESVGGLMMDFFQMTMPPLGLFMSVS